MKNRNIVHNLCKLVKVALPCFLLLFMVSACSMKINLTASQKRDLEQKKFNRFKARQDDSRAVQVACFVGAAAGQWYRDNKQFKK